jgi:hypothetical protein
MTKPDGKTRKRDNSLSAKNRFGENIISIVFSGSFLIMHGHGRIGGDDVNRRKIAAGLMEVMDARAGPRQRCV